jgi:hypothetical protein
MAAALVLGKQRLLTVVHGNHRRTSWEEHHIQNHAARSTNLDYT